MTDMTDEKLLEIIAESICKLTHILKNGVQGAFDSEGSIKERHFKSYMISCGLSLSVTCLRHISEMSDDEPLPELLEEFIEKLRKNIDCPWKSRSELDFTKDVIYE